MLSAEELLAGGSLTYDIEVPVEILNPGGDRQLEPSQELKVRLRPLTVKDLQVVSRAAKDNDSLMATLMVQTALVEPQMSVPQVAALHVGLLQFLLDRVHHISGMAATGDRLAEATTAPLAKASFVLAREFGWTPQQVSELTLGQILVHLQMLREAQPA